jgi:hypothetical protein
MTARCHVCGSPATAAASDFGSSRCDDCAEARNHVVSMRAGKGGTSLAICQCGWRSEVPRRNAYMIQDVKVRMHWRSAIRAAAQAVAA